MKCGECGNVIAPGVGFPNHVYCKRFLLHMEKREDASRCRDFIPKPITNADRLRAMSVEELAEWLWFKVGKCPPFDACPSQCIPCEPKDCWLDWLRRKNES